MAGNDWGDEEDDVAKDLSDQEALDAAKGNKQAKQDTIPDTKAVEEIAGRKAADAAARESALRDMTGAIGAMCDQEGMDDDEAEDITNNVFKRLASDDKFRASKGTRAINKRVAEMAKEIIEKRREKYGKAKGGEKGDDEAAKLGQKGKAKDDDDDESITRDTAKSDAGDEDAPFSAYPGFKAGKQAPTDEDFEAAAERDMAKFRKMHGVKGK